jgi:hypothetical protein
MGGVGSDKAILAIMRWSDREEWRPARLAHEREMGGHVGPIELSH